MKRLLIYALLLAPLLLSLSACSSQNSSSPQSQSTALVPQAVPTPSPDLF